MPPWFALLAELWRLAECVLGVAGTVVRFARRSTPPPALGPDPELLELDDGPELRLDESPTAVPLEERIAPPAPPSAPPPVAPPPPTRPFPGPMDPTMLQLVPVEDVRDMAIRLIILGHSREATQDLILGVIRPLLEEARLGAEAGPVLDGLDPQLLRIVVRTVVRAVANRLGK